MTTLFFSRNLNIMPIRGIGTHVIDSEPVNYHRHNFYEVFYIMEGEAYHLVNNKRQRLVEGDLVFLSLSDAHMFYDTDKAPCIRRDIMISPEIFEAACSYISPTLHSELFSCEVPTVYQISAKKIESFEKRIQNALETAQTDPQLAIQLIKALIIDLIYIDLNRKVNIAAKAIPEWLSSLTVELSDVSLFKTDISEILKNYHYNISYMRRKFKECTGLTMTEFRNQQQLEHAKLLLLSTDSTIEHIADACGFNNVTYFYRCFKRQEGVSPKAYRIRPFYED